MPAGGACPNPIWHSADKQESSNRRQWRRRPPAPTDAACFPRPRRPSASVNIAHDRTSTVNKSHNREHCKDFISHYAALFYFDCTQLSQLTWETIHLQLYDNCHVANAETLSSGPAQSDASRFRARHKTFNCPKVCFIGAQFYLLTINSRLTETA